MHVFRWDLDKTYLDTDFGSVRGMIRTALEAASDKRNVPGAATLLRALIQAAGDCRVSVISGSPTQMRAVLEEKLALDGVQVDHLVLKDNLGNLRRGRLRAVRNQLGYKLPQLLRDRMGLGAASRETLFGDDVEIDALVYTVYADAVAGRLSGREVARIMEIGGAYSDHIRMALDALEHVGQSDAVEDIFIHADRGVPPSAFALLGSRVVPVYSWLQAAVVLRERGRLPDASAAGVVRACMDEGQLSEFAVAGLLQDLVRRRHATPERVLDLLAGQETLAPLRTPTERALGWLGTLSPAPEPRPADYVAFLKRKKK